MSKLAFVFPGQGSQSVGMLSPAMNVYADGVNELFEQASAALGFNLFDMVQQGPAEQLDQTANTQPALLATSLAWWHIWQKYNANKPTVMAGHSLGEYSALVAAKAMDFGDAVKLVHQRGVLMQQAVPQGSGAMAAIIGLSDDDVAAICQDVAQGDVVAPANYNAVGQVVISGENRAIDRAIAKAQEAGAKIAKKLAVSVPSHCELMRDAATQFTDAVNAVAISAPTVPVIHNTVVEPLSHPDDIRQALVAQLYQPVRWVETIQRFAAEGVTDAIECGPGKVLTGLIKRIERGITCKPIETEQFNSHKEYS